MNHFFRSPAEIAVAVQQWIEMGSVYQASWYAREAYRLARRQNPSVFRDLESD